MSNDWHLHTSDGNALDFVLFFVYIKFRERRAGAPEFMADRIVI